MFYKSRLTEAGHETGLGGHRCVCECSKILMFYKSKLIEAGRETGLGEPRCIRAASISRSTFGLPAFSATRARPLPAATRLKTFTAASRSGFRGPTSQKDASDSQKVLSKRGRHMSTAVTLTVQISAGMLLRKVLPPTRTGLSQTGASGSNTFSDTMER